MKYPVTIDGFDGQMIEVQSAGMLSGPKLMVNGVEAPKGPKRGQFTLTRSDGSEAIASWKAGLGSLGGIPQLSIDGQVIDVVEPVPWYAMVWSALPLVLIALGGAIGAVVGLIAFTSNMRLFRGEQSTAVKFALTAVITAVAFGAYFVVALLLAMMFG